MNASARSGPRKGAALRALLLDFRRVTGVDSSGWHNFHKIVELGAQDRFRVVLSQLPRGLEQAVRLEGMLDAGCDHVRLVEDIDRGLEFLEEELLAWPSCGLAEAPAAFDGADREPALVDGLAAYAERRAFDPGEALIGQGDASEDVFIVRSGWIAVVVDGPNGEKIRLRRAGPGTVVGEIAFILRRPRTASAIADTAVVADRLSPAALARMAAEDPHLLLACRRPSCASSPGASPTAPSSPCSSAASRAAQSSGKPNSLGSRQTNSSRSSSMPVCRSGEVDARWSGPARR